MANEELTKVLYADREKILEELLAVAKEGSTWISECSLSPEDKEAAVVCLAEISGAVRLVMKLLNMEKLEFIHAFDGVEDERS